MPVSHAAPRRRPRPGRQAGRRPIAAATEALARAAAGRGAERVALLDLRAESLIAQGRFADAAPDAADDAGAGRCAAAARARGPGAEPPGAGADAPGPEQGGAGSRPRRPWRWPQASRDQALAGPQPAAPGRGAAARRQPEAARGHGAAGAAACSKRRATGLGLGRAHWVIAFAQTRLSRNEASRAAAQRAVELARQTGDEDGLATALNVLSFSCTDIAERLALLQQAAQAFERAGHAVRPHAGLGNLSLAFAELGLWRHACRLGERAARRPSAWARALNLALETRRDADAGSSRWATSPARGRSGPPTTRWSTALDEPLTARRPRAVGQRAGPGRGRQRAALEAPARVPAPGARDQPRLRAVRADSAGQGAAAARATPRRRCAPRGAAPRCTRKRGFARTGFGQSQDIWWWHSRALAAQRPRRRGLGRRCSVPTACCWRRCATCATKACAAAT